MKKPAGRAPRQLLLVILLGLLIRIAGVPWGLFNYDNFEPDEWQHITIARNLINEFDKDVIIEKEEITTHWYAKGFGTQIAVIGYPILKIFKLPSHFLYLIGRLLSLFYSLLLLILVYRIALYLFKDEQIAIVSSLILAVSDLNITYSHYSIPHICQAFFSYICIFFSILLYNFLKSRPVPELFKSSHKWLILGLPLSCALTVSLRFDISSIVLLVAVFLVLFVRLKAQRKDLTYLLILVLILMAGFFAISVFSDYNLSNFREAAGNLLRDNLRGVQKRNNLLLNPMLYLFAVFSGTSFMIFLAAILGLSYLRKRNKEYCRSINGLAFLIFLGFHFIVLWQGGATFVRHANIFIPYIAIIASYGLVSLSRELKNMHVRRLIIVISIGYTLLLALISQKNFVFDNRYKAADYLNENYKTGYSILYTHYAKSKLMPDGIIIRDADSLEGIDVVVMHESYYGRYWKFFTTPFQVPEDVSRVFHGTEKDMAMIQSLLKGESDFVLAKSFPIKHFLPDRLLFKYLFGTYETFMGDVLIYTCREKQVSRR